MSCFFLVAAKIFSIYFVFQQSDYNVSLFVFDIILLVVHLNFDSVNLSLTKLEIFQLLFHQIFFLPYSLSPLLLESNVKLLSVVPYNTETLFIYL